MVFGVFDGLHPGHRDFLRQAGRFGKKPTVVVARDSAVCKLKNKRPHWGERIRLRAVRKIKGVGRAVLGDETQSSYSVIKKFKPDIICLGYDQKRLEKDLRSKMRRRLIPAIRTVRLKAFKPRRFKTSILNRSRK